MNLVPASRLVCLALAGAGAAGASAAEVEFSRASQPAGICQPAREYSMSSWRSRAYDATEYGNTYIVCAPPAYADGGRLTRITLRFMNRVSDDRQLSCTLQNGLLPAAATVNRTRPLHLAPDDTETLSFAASEFGLFAFDAPGIQCVLPRNIALGVIVMDYVETDVDTQ